MTQHSEATLDEFAHSEGWRLLRLAYLLTGNQTDAEDLLQETFEQLQRKWVKVSEADDPVAYSCQVLVNRHLAGKRRKYLPTGALDETVPNQFQDAYELYDDADLVSRALRTLPSRQRTALVLKYYFGLDSRDIAQYMGIDAGSVRSAASRGLEHIRLFITASSTTMEAEK